MIRSVVEASPQRVCGCIILGHWRQAKYQFHRAEQGGCCIWCMINKSLFNKTSGYQGNAPVGIDMIRPILCIIFNSYDQALFPDRTMAEIVKEHTCSQVIISNVCKWCRFVQA